MFDKKELIKKFLLDEKLPEEEKRLRFEIAWDIWENFENIKIELKQDLIRKLKEKIEQSEEFKDYMIINDGLIEKQKYGKLLVFKKEWRLLENIGILHYALEAEQSNICHMYIGIRKFNEDNGIPFKGNWQAEKEIGENLLGIIKKIYSTLGGSNKNWQSENLWIAWKYLDEPYKGMWQKEFYFEIITKDGFEKVRDYLFNQFLELKNKTETLIDEFVEKFRNLKKNKS